MAATHAHIDHVAAAAELQQILGLPLHLHQAEVPLLNIVPQQARWFGFDHADVPADLRLLAEGDELRVGSLLFLIRETPGHSPGGLTFVAGGSAFVGDAVFAGSIGRADLPGGSSAQLLDSIRRQILTLPSDTRLYPGHGPATTVRREATSNPFLL